MPRHPGSSLGLGFWIQDFVVASDEADAAEGSQLRRIHRGDDGHDEGADSAAGDGDLGSEDGIAGPMPGPTGDVARFGIPQIVRSADEHSVDGRDATAHVVWREGLDHRVANDNADDVASAREKESDERDPERIGKTEDNGRECIADDTEQQGTASTFERWAVGDEDRYQDRSHSRGGAQNAVPDFIDLEDFLLKDGHHAGSAAEKDGEQVDAHCGQQDFVSKDEPKSAGDVLKCDCFRAALRWPRFHPKQDCEKSKCQDGVDGVCQPGGFHPTKNETGGDGTDHLREMKRTRAPSGGIEECLGCGDLRQQGLPCGLLERANHAMKGERGVEHPHGIDPKGVDCKKRCGCRKQQQRDRHDSLAREAICNVSCHKRQRDDGRRLQKPNEPETRIRAGAIEDLPGNGGVLHQVAHRGNEVTAEIEADAGNAK